MEEKYKRFKDYNYKDDKKWQMYLNNLYPVPPLKLLEKKKRKWYKDNIDQDFDINYNPEEAKGNEDRQQQRQRQGPPPGANPYAYAYQQATYEAMPHIKTYVAIAYLLFVLTLPFSGITNKVLLAAWVLGILNKAGIPKFNLDYVRQIIPDDHFQNLGYLGVAVFVGGTNFIVYAPLVLYALIYVSDVGVEYLRQNPNSSIPGIIKTYMQKAVAKKIELLTLRADLEIYVGIYLLVGIFIGFSSLISVFFYSQFIRLKYMLNYTTKQAFERFRVMIDGSVNSPNMPGLIKTVWGKIKDAAAWLVKFEQPQEGQQAPSMCTIF